MTETVVWDTFEGGSYAYLSDGHEIQISARTRYSRWGGVDSNTRQWIINDGNNSVVARGESEGLRAAKVAALTALGLHK